MSKELRYGSTRSPSCKDCAGIGCIMHIASECVSEEFINSQCKGGLHRNDPCCKYTTILNIEANITDFEVIQRNARLKILSKIT